MAFDNEDWTRRLKLAKSTDEITAMIMELPDPPETAEADPVSIFMAQRKNSRSSTSTTPNEKTKDG